jgi:hypothetical protein
MKSIKQKHDDDCGIACIAMLSRKTYGAVRTEMFPFRTPENTVKKWLGEFGVRTASKFQDLNGRHYSELEFDALLAVNYRKEGLDLYWHWVVWDAKKGKIRDPNRPSGGGRYRAERFLRIYGLADAR